MTNGRQLAINGSMALGGAAPHIHSNLAKFIRTNDSRRNHENAKESNCFDRARSFSGEYVVERRAGLLIFVACLTQQNGFQSMHATSGSASLCSDGRRTYVLLFNGNDREMPAYMAKMGIDT